MSELDELNAELTRIVRVRADIVAGAMADIERANREFDEAATELHRKIKRLTPKPQAETVVTPVTRKRGRPRGELSLAGLEDWTPEEIARYKQLRGVA